MSRKSNKVLRNLSDLGNEFDVSKLESEMINDDDDLVNAKVQLKEDKERVDIKMNENKPVEKEVIKEVENITLEQLKSELILNKDSLFKGISMYFNKRLDYTQRQIKSLDEKLDQVNNKLEVLLNKEEGLKRVIELEDKINKLQEVLKM